MDDAVARARDLEARDRELAGAIEELRELEREVERIRGSAEEIQAALTSYPIERAALELRRGEAVEELARRRARQAQAEQALERARGRASREGAAEAEREAARAREAAVAAEAALARVDRSILALDERKLEADRTIPVLARAALTAHGKLEARPRVDSPGLPPRQAEELAAWAGRARAALLLARSGLEREREGVVREANEMGAALLGDPLFAGGVAGLRRRLEAR